MTKLGAFMLNKKTNNIGQWVKTKNFLVLLRIYLIFKKTCVYYILKYSKQTVCMM